MYNHLEWSKSRDSLGLSSVLLAASSGVIGGAGFAPLRAKRLSTGLVGRPSHLSLVDQRARLPVCPGD